MNQISSLSEHLHNINALNSLQHVLQMGGIKFLHML
jgi:hypothetical protein